MSVDLFPFTQNFLNSIFYVGDSGRVTLCDMCAESTFLWLMSSFVINHKKAKCCDYAIMLAISIIC